MNLDFLKRLYWACSDQDHAFSDGMDLGELYERTEDTARATAHFNEKLLAAELATDERDTLGCLNTSTADAYEQQGFINGFRIGMKLAEELHMGREYPS